MVYRLLIIASILFSGITFAEDVIVYRWVDADGVVHYSQHQPEHDNYTELTINKDFKSNKAKDSTHNRSTATQSKRSNQATTNNNTSGNSNDANDKCEVASSNLKTLLEFTNIQYETADGEMKTLTEKEKEQQLELSKKEVEIYCSN